MSIEREGKEPNEMEQQEFAGFKVGGNVEWVDDATANQFSRPVFGYGSGPFELKKIVVKRAFLNLMQESGKRIERYSNNVVLVIQTPKGEAELSADLLKPKN